MVDAKENLGRRLSSLIEDFRCQYCEKGSYVESVEPVKGWGGSRVYRIVIKLPKQHSSFYVKIAATVSDINKYRIDKEYKKTRYVRSIFTGTKKNTVVKPLAYYEHYVGFVMESIEGRRLDELLARWLRWPVTKKNRENALKFMDYCAEWIRDLQRNAGKYDATLHGETEFKPDRISNLVENLVGQNYNLLYPGLDKKLLDKADRLLSALGPGGGNTFIKHSDFAPWNILVNSDGISVIDFANVNVDLEHYDVFYFIDALNKIGNKLFIDKYSVRKLQQYFIEKSGCAQCREEYREYYELLFILTNMHALAKYYGGNVLRRIKLRRLLKQHVKDLEIILR